MFGTRNQRRFVVLNKAIAAGTTAMLSFLPFLPPGGNTTPANSAIEIMELTPEVEEYLDDLPEEDRLRIENTLLLDHEEQTFEPQSPSDLVALGSQIGATLSGETVSPLAKGCWTSRTNRSGKAKAGNTLYTYYHVGRWCSSGTVVTSSNVADSGGETKTPGWRYEGVTKRGTGIVSNQGRSYSQYRFVLGVGGWDIQTPTPCARVRGTSAGTATSDGVCGIY